MFTMWFFFSDMVFYSLVGGRLSAQPLTGYTQFPLPGYPQNDAEIKISQKLPPCRHGGFAGNPCALRIKLAENPYPAALQGTCSSCLYHQPSASRLQAGNGLQI